MGRSDFRAFHLCRTPRVVLGLNAQFNPYNYFRSVLIILFYVEFFYLQAFYLTEKGIIKLIKIAALKSFSLKQFILNRYFNLCYNTDAKKAKFICSFANWSQPIIMLSVM